MRVPGYFCIAMLCTNTRTRFKQSVLVVRIKLAVTTQKAVQSHSPTSRRGHGVDLIYHVSEVHLASYSACQPVVARLRHTSLSTSFLKMLERPTSYSRYIKLGSESAWQSSVAPHRKDSKCEHKPSTAF